MAWWSKERAPAKEAQVKKSVPKGIWRKCPECQEPLFEPDLAETQWVCEHCDAHLPMATEERVRLMVDPGTFVAHDLEIQSEDPLTFQVDGKKYKDGIKRAEKKTGLTEAFVAGSAELGGIPVEMGFFVFEFMGGSMGSAVGERMVRQLERAYESRRPALLFCASGGARMHEGILSLMQMAKSSAAISRLRQESIPYISILLHPTTGGVAASCAMLGDVIFAEPKALIGFAGPRVIEQTIRQKLPEGFQRSEFLLEHGIIDAIVHRRDLRDRLIRTLVWTGYGPKGARANG